MKYQLQINKRQSTGSKHLNDSKAFIEYSNDMDDIYKNIEEYNLNKKRKLLIVFDDIKHFSCFCYTIFWLYNPLPFRNNLLERI